MRRQDIIELLKTVRRMRSAQRDYFAARTDVRLRRAKQLEYRVDRELERILGAVESKENEQRDLFK